LLPLSENGIGPSGAAAIAAALSHSFLRELSLFSVFLGIAGQSMIKQLLVVIIIIANCLGGVSSVVKVKNTIAH